MGTVIKLLLSILAAGVGYIQFLELKTIATTFCFIISAVTFLGFLLDLYRLWKRKRTASRKSQSAPTVSDYQDAPAPADLKIGTTYRASLVDRYIDNIQSLLEETPEYKLSESEIIDNYLTDKKIWKYSFHSKPVVLKNSTAKDGVSCMDILISQKQVGILEGPQCEAILNAQKENKQVEVVYCTIGGGPYKVVTEDVYTGQYNMKTAETGYSVTLSIFIQ